jgi:signal transduction histidine kinase
MHPEFDEYLQLASHELKGPLRKIRTFGELLESKSSEVLDEESLRYLERMKKNIDLMQSLVDALTQFASFNIKNTGEICDLNLILTNVATDFESLRGGEKLPIRSGELPVVTGNPEALKEVFRLLLNNSFKFHSPDRPLEINISSEEIGEADKSVLGLPFDIPYKSVKFADNGIGFKQEDHELIFKPFVQLNGKSGFGGHGLGLALAKKIIGAHNGIIYASGNESGCCITLILPISGQ